MTAAALLAVAVAAAPAGQAEFDYATMPDEPGRPRVILAPRDSPQATLSVTFDVGSYDEEGIPGLTRLAQHAMLEANPRVPYEKLVTALYRANATLQLDTGQRECGFRLTAPRDEFERLADQLTSLVLAPRIDGGRLAAAAERTRLDQREPDRPGSVLVLLTSTIASDPRYANDTYGDPDQIDMISVEQVRAHVARWMVPGNATVVFAGGFSPATATRMLRRFRGGARHAPEPLALDLPIDSSIGAASETHFIAYPFLLARPRDPAALRVLAALLQTRLERQARAAGVGYSPVVFPWHSRWANLLVVRFSVSAGGEAVAASLLKDEIAAIREGRVSDEELEQHRRFVLEQLRVVDRTPADLAAILSAGDGTGWYGPGLAGALAGLTRADFFASASRWLADSSRVHILFSRNAPARILVSPPTAIGRRR
jgi:predicted Zn-dependent peptidase